MVRGNTELDEQARQLIEHLNLLRVSQRDHDSVLSWPFSGRPRLSKTSAEVGMLDVFRQELQICGMHP